jgi:hypothetical protein
LDRTRTSSRAEAAYRDWKAVPPSQRPLVVARRRAAPILDHILHEHWLRGDYAVSNVALAERWCGVTEKTIRQWRDGEKPMPFEALLVLPPSLCDELFDALNDARGRTPRHAFVLLRAALDAVEHGIANEDRRELQRELGDAQQRLAVLLACLAEEEARR